MTAEANMVEDELMYGRLKAFMEAGLISGAETTLVVCGGELDRRVLGALGFRDFLITGRGEAVGVPGFRVEDAERLTFVDGSFDNVIVHSGLHHCLSPHRALCEMYRVARRNVVVFEAQDSMLLRAAARVGFCPDYELDAVRQNAMTSGGAANSGIPNHVYRWTRREILKLLRSLDPVREPRVVFETEFYFNPCHMEGFLKGHMLTRALGHRAMRAFMSASVFALNLALRGQGNSLTALIMKSGALHPWIRETKEGYVFTG
jgi:SAM-dependent methyltransferase